MTIELLHTKARMLPQGGASKRKEVRELISFILWVIFFTIGKLFRDNDF